MTTTMTTFPIIDKDTLAVMTEEERNKIEALATSLTGKYPKEVEEYRLKEAELVDSKELLLWCFDGGGRYGRDCLVAGCCLGMYQRIRDSIPSESIFKLKLRVVSIAFLVARHNGIAVFDFPFRKGLPAEIVRDVLAMLSIA